MSTVPTINEHQVAKSRFQLAVECAPTAVVIANHHGEIILTNELADKLFGYRSDELLHQPVEVLVPESSRQGHPGLRRDFFLHPQERPLGHGRDLYARRKDGSLLPVEIGLHPVQVGGCQWVLVSIVDITRRKQAENALRESEEKQGLLLESTAEAIFGIDLDARCTFCNPATLRMLGYQRREDLIGRNMHQLIHHSRPDDTPYPAEACPILDALRIGTGVHIQDEVLWRADGTSFHAEYWSNPQRRGEQVVGAVIAFIDITERKRIEQALKKSEEKFATAFRESPTALTLTNAKDHHYIDINETFEHMSGYSRQEALGRTPMELGIWIDVEHRLELVRRLLAGDEVREFEVGFRRKDGSTGIGLGSAELIEIDGEQLVLSSIADITERKQAEEMLRGMSGKLIEAQEQERRRIARELHDDINQRLALLAMDLQQLQDKAFSPEDVCGRAEELFQRTVGISSDIQALSHRLHSSTLEYLGLVPAMQSFCSELAKHQTLEVDFAHRDVPSPLPAETALGLFRVFQEALQNAARHSGVRKIEVRLVGVGGGVQLAVRDHGKGFDACAAMRGEGLGLLSMRERINLLKGTMSIVSKPGEGTEITAWVPAPNPRLTTEATEVCRGRQRSD